MTLGLLTAMVLGFVAPDDVVVEWLAAPGCPPQEAVERRIARLRKVESGSTMVTARVRIEQADVGYVARLQVQADERVDERRLDARSCEAIADAVALIVALRADEWAPTLPSEPQVPDEIAASRIPIVVPRSIDARPPVVTRAAPVESIRRTTEPSSPRRPRARPRSTASARVSIATGPWPGFGALAGGSFGVTIGRVTVDLVAEVGSGLPAEERDVEAGIRFVAGRAHALVGYRWPFPSSPLAFAIRGGPSAGPVAAGGFGADRNRWQVQPWVSATAGALLERRLATANRVWWLGLGAEISTSLVRPRFSIEPLGVVHTVPRWVLQTLVRLRWGGVVARRPKRVTPRV